MPTLLASLEGCEVKKLSRPKQPAKNAVLIALLFNFYAGIRHYSVPAYFAQSFESEPDLHRLAGESANSVSFVPSLDDLKGFALSPRRP